MNFKRKKCKRTVKCTMCTQHRWFGNSGKAENRKRDREQVIQKEEMHDLKSSKLHY